MLPPKALVKPKSSNAIDAKESTLRIVDYKTGGNPKTPANIEQLFTPSETRPNYIFQTHKQYQLMPQDR